MRLVSLRLRNIRSYVDETVDFGDGVNLFEGDIGSGKSTILLGVEFALFGLAEVASRSLVRHGEREASVELVFEVKGQRVRAARGLRRTDGGAQVRDCALELDGKETKLSSTEMRRRVLDILEFGEHRNPKARLDIYRYTIYTPQEDMRTVLQGDARMLDQRKDTLRRALELDEYRQMVLNLAEVRREIGRDAIRLEGMASAIDDTRQELEEAREELATEEAGREAVDRDLDAASAEAAAARERLEVLRERERGLHRVRAAAKDAEGAVARAEGELRGLEAELEAAGRDQVELEDVRKRLAGLVGAMGDLEGLEATEARVRDLRRDLQAGSKELERLRSRLESAEEAMARMQELGSTLKSMEDPAPALQAAREELEGLRERSAALGHEMEGLRRASSEVEAETRELTELEGEATCPRCRQPLTEEHLQRLVEENGARERELGSQLREAAARSNRIADTIGAREAEIRELERAMEERRRISSELERAEEMASGVEGLRESLKAHPATRMEEELQGLEANFDEGRLRELRRVSGVVEELRGNERRLVRSVGSIPDMEAGREGAERVLEEARGDLERATTDLEEAETGMDPRGLEEARASYDRAIEAEAALGKQLEGVDDLIDRLQRGVERLTGRVEGLEDIQRSQAVHEEVADWLRDRVVPAVEAMERSVMSLLAEEMDISASQWFAQLVEDPDLVLSIDEDFVPSVAYQDYDMDLDALSGGERTAAAFAYRLALNGLVRRNATPEQRNLLILDEPTDGFSREQLARMGNVFGQLEADQVVIVSHDRELRAFADRVYMVEKTGGPSRVTQVV